jgi:hypothetical protein
MEAGLGIRDRGFGEAMKSGSPSFCAAEFRIANPASLRLNESPIPNPESRHLQ